MPTWRAGCCWVGVEAMLVRVSSGVADAFELLGLEARFDLTAGEVRAAYLARVGGVHPDRGGDESEGAAGLNAAKTALSDPESRANLLLARMGGPSKEINRELPEGFL